MKTALPTKRFKSEALDAPIEISCSVTVDESGYFRVEVPEFLEAHCRKR